MVDYLVLNPPLGPERFPMLKQLNTNEIVKIWDGACSSLRRELLQKNAVNIGIGTFAVFRDHMFVEKGEAVAVLRPMFQLCHFLKRFYALRYAQRDIPAKMPVVQLNYRQIAKDTSFPTVAVKRCIEETLLFFSGTLAEGKDVQLVFKDVGILSVKRQVVTMKFFDHHLMEVDATGTMIPAVHMESEVTDILTFDTQSDFHWFSHDGVIVLPRFALEFPGKTSLRARSVKPREEVVPGERHKSQGSQLDPVFLAREKIPLAKLAVKYQEESKGIGGGRGRFLPSIPERPSKTDRQAKTQARSHFERPVCAHVPSGKNICRYVTEDPGPPSHVIRNEHEEKLKEHMQKKTPKNGHRGASEEGKEARLPERPQKDFHSPRASLTLKLLKTYKAQQDERARKAALKRDTVKQEKLLCKGEKKQLFDRCGMTQALPVISGGCDQTQGVQGVTLQPLQQMKVAPATIYQQLTSASAK